MAQAQASAYNPTLRDQIAVWLLGDDRPSVARRNFVEGLLGSSGSGTKGGSLSDFTPASIVFSAQDAKRSFDNGAYGSAALDAVGALPGALIAGTLKPARNAVKPLEDVIAKAFGGTLERTEEAAARAAERSRRLEKTNLVKALQWAGRPPDEIRRALAEFDAADAYRGTQPRPPAAETPRSADALPAFDDAAATERVRAAHEIAPAPATDWDHLVAIINKNPNFAKLFDEHELKYYPDDATEWSGPFGRSDGPTILVPFEKRKKGQPKQQDDSHHAFQHAAVRDIFRYYGAPSIRIGGRANVKGSPHHLATQVQRAPGGGTLGAELGIGVQGLRQKPDLTTEGLAQAMWEMMQFGKFHKLSSDTPTRIPGNRKKPPVKNSEDEDVD